MLKITDITEKKFRTSYVRDTLGNRQRKTTEYLGKRQVKTVHWGLRAVHYIGDSLAFQIVIAIFQAILALLGLLSPSENIGIVFFIGANIFLLLFYPALYVLFEYKWQRTPCKFLTGSYVIDEYGNKPELATIILRTLIRIVPFEGFTFMGNPCRGWHDKWAKTFVVDKEELKELRRLVAEQTAK